MTDGNFSDDLTKRIKVQDCDLITECDAVSLCDMLKGFMREMYDSGITYGDIKQLGNTLKEWQAEDWRGDDDDEQNATVTLQ